LRGIARLPAALAVAALAGACAFQPLYGEHSPTAGPAVVERLGGVNVLPINAANGTPQARVALELRNALIFDLTGGSGALAPTHDLKIAFSPTRQQVIVDVVTGRAEIENFGIDATYTLTDLATKKPVVTASTFARVSYDIPGQQQRFASARGLRDAENRAAKVIADQIRTRLASFFAAGT
jgi:LPS-assembly lipoprotein